MQHAKELPIHIETYSQALNQTLRMQQNPHSMYPNRKLLMSSKLQVKFTVRQPYGMVKDGINLDLDLNRHRLFTYNRRYGYGWVLILVMKTLGKEFSMLATGYRV